VKPKSLSLHFISTVVGPANGNQPRGSRGSPISGSLEMGHSYTNNIQTHLLPFCSQRYFYFSVAEQRQRHVRELGCCIAWPQRRSRPFPPRAGSPSTSSTKGDRSRRDALALEADAPVHYVQPEAEGGAGGVGGAVRPQHEADPVAV